MDKLNTREKQTQGTEGSPHQKCSHDDTKLSGRQRWTGVAQGSIAASYCVEGIKGIASKGLQLLEHGHCSATDCFFELLLILNLSSAVQSADTRSDLVTCTAFNKK